MITGQFQFQQAATSFALVILMGILIGIAIGFIFYAIHKWLPVTPSIEIVLTLLAPYCMYYFAERFHFSGVLAVVSGGLLLSSKRQSMLDYRSRIQGINVWTNLVFVMNGLIFLLIGLQLPSIVQQLGDIGLTTAIWYGLAISFALIITRLICTLGASVFTRIMSNFITVADPNPGWKMPFIAGWAGMRGVVSLAAALSIPLLTSGGQAFPHRNLILFITFVVILVTLVFQGLTLPWVIRKMNITEERPGVMPEQEQEVHIQKKITMASIQTLEDKFDKEILKDKRIGNLSERLKIDLASLQDLNDNSLNTYQEAYLQLLEAQRKKLIEMNQKAEFDEELIRKYLALIDMEEYKLRERMMPHEQS
jgi:monovalent cation/hydrogen antiporter